MLLCTKSSFSFNKDFTIVDFANEFNDVSQGMLLDNLLKLGDGIEPDNLPKQYQVINSELELLIKKNQQMAVPALLFFIV
jgi:hypothetical protein